jgi:tetratricopeptide (TPR) repeat protein
VDKNWKGYPYLGCKFIEENKIKGKVFNWDGFGNYFIFKFWPKREVFVDGRFNEVYQRDFLENTYRYIQLAKEKWEEIFEKYDIQYVFTHVEDASPLVHQLIHHPEWYLVYWDDICKIYLKKEKNQKIIDSFAYTIVNPLHFDIHSLPSSLLRQALTELRYNLELNPACFKAHAMLGMVYLKLKKVKAAIKEFKECIKLNPRSIYVYYNLGLAYEMEGNFLEAIKYYKKEIKKNPYFLSSYEGISFCYKKLGNEILAKKWLYLGEKKKKKLQNKMLYF